MGERSKRKHETITLRHFHSELHKRLYLAEDGLHSVGVKPHLTLPAELLVVHLSRFKIIHVMDSYECRFRQTYCKLAHARTQIVVNGRLTLLVPEMHHT